MKNQQIRASFVYNGKEIFLTPEDMETVSEGVWKRTLDDGLEAVLECEFPSQTSFTALLRFRNGGQSLSGRITLPRTLDLELPTGGEPVVWHSLRGDSCGGESFLPLTETLHAGGSHHVEPFGGRSSNTTGFPFFDLRFGSRALVCAIGWTGQWSENVTVGQDTFRLTVGLCDADFSLKPGEEVRCPSAIVMLGCEVSALRRDFRRLLLEKYSPKTRLGGEMKLPCAIQPFDRYFYTHPIWSTEEGQLKTLSQAMRCGHFDTYWLDAAWFREGFPTGVGNFSFAKGFPEGLKKVSDAAHAMGLKMMLWFEPERIYEGSEVYALHGDMLLRSKDDPHQRLFNLGDPHALDWLTDTLITFMEDNGIDIYRQDFNIEPLPFWREADTEGRRGITEMKYVAGLYTLWDRLIDHFPKLFIDNCSSGGRRIDFETCKRSVPMWRSDTGCSPEAEDRHISVWNNNQILGLAEYLPYQSAGVWSYEPYDFRAAATEGIACNFDFLAPDFDYRSAGKVLAEMQRLRMLWEGDFYPMTEATLDETVWSAYQLALADRGACWFFRRAESGETERVFRLRAVDADKNYEISVTGETMETATRVVKGSELENGVTITLPTPRSSAVLEYAEKQ